jgi:hypothetical protein
MVLGISGFFVFARDGTIVDFGSGDVAQAAADVPASFATISAPSPAVVRTMLVNCGAA